MKKIILAFSLAALSSIAAFGQTTTSDYKKGEFYVGYSNGQVDTGVETGDSIGDFFEGRANFHGINASGVYNVNRYFGIKGDVSATYNKTVFTSTFPDPLTGTPVTFNFRARNSLYNVVGGVQIKDNSNEGRFKPFAHAMTGLGHARTKFTNAGCTPANPSGGCPFADSTFSSNGWAFVLGGGLDFRLNNRIQIRAVQFDYNPIRFDGATDHNLRIGAGIVF